MCRGRIFLRFGRVLLELQLFDINADPLPVFRGDTIVVEQIHVSVPGEWLWIGVSMALSGDWAVLTIVLSDLVARGLILVEVVFPVKSTDGLDLAV